MSENFTTEEVGKMAFEAYNTSTVPAFMAMTDAALIDAARKGNKP